MGMQLLVASVLTLGVGPATAQPARHHPAPPAQENPVPNPSLQRLISAKNEESKQEDVREPELEGLGRVIDRVGTAFELGNADELEECLVPKKIYLSLKARGEEAGYFGRSQIKFMFEKLFRERKTHTFTFDPKDIEVSGGGSAYFRSNWSYVVLDAADDIVTEHLRFKAERIKDDWRISEIRTQTR